MQVDKENFEEAFVQFSELAPKVKLNTLTPSVTS